mgnify:CR=1 FL=1
MEDRPAVHVLIDNWTPHLSVRRSNLIDGQKIFTPHNFTGDRIEVVFYCHGMDGLNFGHCKENTLAIKEKLGALNCEGVATLFLGVLHRPVLGAVLASPFVVPLLGRPAVDVLSNFFVERRAEGEADSVGVDFHSDGLTYGLASVTHALEAAIADGGGLPAKQAADVKMAVLGIKSTATRTREETAR